MKTIIKDTEKLLNTLGEAEDSSYLIMEQHQSKIIKTYDLYENKYNDSTDDSLCVEIHSDGTFIVTNEDLPYGCSSEKETQLLEKLFHNSSFQLDVKISRHSPYIAAVSVCAKVALLSELEKIIFEYREFNDQFLSDKVTTIIGDDGTEYLDRI